VGTIVNVVIHASVVQLQAVQQKRNARMRNVLVAKTVNAETIANVEQVRISVHSVVQTANVDQVANVVMFPSAEELLLSEN